MTYAYEGMIFQYNTVHMEGYIHVRNERRLIFRSLPRPSFRVQIECIHVDEREIEP